MSDKKRQLLVPAIVFSLFALAPLIPVVNSSYGLDLLIRFLMWSLIGMGWNLLGGYCGQVSFGHASFFGLGAYTAGVAYFQYQLSAWWGFPLVFLTVTAGALIIGFICLRLRGPYFTLGTLAMGEVLRVTAENIENYTGGARGIMLERRTWVDKEPYLYTILVLVVVAYAVIQWVVNSRWGYYFVAIREDQDAAESLGIPTTLYKNIALVLSALLTGLAGAFYMNYMGYIDPSIVFSLPDISTLAIMVVMVGGAATRWGPFVGASIMVLLSEVVRSLPKIGAAHQTLFGVLLILIIIFLPNGIVGDYRKFLKPFRTRRVQAGGAE